jgi:NAD(P)H-flavin reductase
MGGQPKPIDKQQNFLVPAEGGALQRMTKDKDDNISLRLQKKIKITHDTYIFRFEFPNSEHTMGLPIGNHVIFNAHIPTPAHPEGELVCRKYTPTSEITNKGYVDFVIKVYRKGVHPRFPDGGIMS